MTAMAIAIRCPNLDMVGAFVGIARAS